MRRTIQSFLAVVTALAFAVSGVASHAFADDPPRSDVKTPPLPGIDKLPPGFTEIRPGVVTGPPGSYGNAHNGLSLSHGKCVIVTADKFRPPNKDEKPADYGDYIRKEVQKIWRAEFGKEGDDFTLHEGTVMGFQPGKGYSVCAVTCAPVPYKPHEKFAVATVDPANPTKPGSGGAGYHMPGKFYGPAFGTNQHGGCSVAAHEWMGDAVTFPLGAPDQIQNVARPPRPQPPPPTGGPKPPGAGGPPPPTGPGAGGPKPPGPGIGGPKPPGPPIVPGGGSGGPKPPGPPEPPGVGPGSGGPKPPGPPEPPGGGPGSGGPKPPGGPGGPKPPGGPGGPKPPGGPRPAGPGGPKLPR